jgi:hypothetical protein
MTYDNEWHLAQANWHRRQAKIQRTRSLRWGHKYWYNSRYLWHKSQQRWHMFLPTIAANISNHNALCRRLVEADRVRVEDYEE